MGGCNSVQQPTLVLGVVYVSFISWDSTMPKALPSPGQSKEAIGGRLKTNSLSVRVVYNFSLCFDVSF